MQRYVADEWPLRRIADKLDRSAYRVRAEMVTAGVTIVHRGGVSRQDRAEVPPERVEQLYVVEGLTAEQSGDTLGVASGLVLRSGHSYGLPIRPGGAAPLVPADVRLIEDLYADDLVRTVLDRHRLPRRAPIGGIAIRFPEPVALSQELVRDLYQQAGCSSTHIELLTGQAAVTVRRRMAEWGIHLRGAPTSPFLRRVRAIRRQQWLQGVAERYQQSGSTRQLAYEYGCSQNTIERWMREAGVKLPGRGQWERSAQRRQPRPGQNRRPTTTKRQVESASSMAVTPQGGAGSLTAAAHT